MMQENNQSPQSNNIETSDSNNQTHSSHSYNQTITVFAKTNFRNQFLKFGIKRADRRAHLYLLGKTGTGKSTLLETLMMDDVKKGFGFALLDPHGDLVKKIKSQ